MMGSSLTLSSGLWLRCAGTGNSLLTAGCSQCGKYETSTSKSLSFCKACKWVAYCRCVVLYCMCMPLGEVRAGRGCWAPCRQAGPARGLPAAGLCSPAAAIPRCIHAGKGAS